VTEQELDCGGRLLGYDPVTEDVEHLVPGEVGYAGHPSVVEAHHPFDEPGAELWVAPGAQNSGGGCGSSEDSFPSVDGAGERPPIDITRLGSI